MKILIFAVFILVASVFAENIEVVQKGEVLVNGIKVEGKIPTLKYGDKVETKKGSKFRFKIGKEAFLVSSNSKFSLQKDKDKNVINLVKGSIMGVFSKGNHELKTPNMTAGIRGTGVYAKVQEGKTYFCTCYGSTGIQTHYATDSEVISAKHHNMVWVNDDKILHTADMRFHTDDELRALEKMVGRVPSFDMKVVKKR